MLVALGAAAAIILVRGRWRRPLLVLWVAAPPLALAGLLTIIIVDAPTSEAAIEQSWMMVILFGALALGPWLMASAGGLILTAAARWLLRRVREQKQA